MKLAIIEGTPAEVADVLARLEATKNYRRPSAIGRITVHMDAIIAIAAAQTGQESAEILTENRDREPSYARHLSWFLMRDEGYGPMKIAQHFKRNHSSIIEGSDRVERELWTRGETVADVVACKAAIERRRESTCTT